MTAPTREQIWDWALAAHEEHGETMTDAWVTHFARLAFAAGQPEPVVNRAAEYSTPSTAGGCDDLRGLLRRCRPIVQADAQMMADITRHAPLDPQSQATHDTTEYESEKLLPLIDAALAGDARPCTCHPDDNPPKPCPRKYALSECRAAASGSGAELVREVERVRDESGPRWTAHALVQRWDRLRAALLDGDAAREDAERWRTLPALEADHQLDLMRIYRDIDKARGGK